MAAAAIQQELKCCICLNIYSEPTTLPCGHTHCKQCILQTLQTSGQRSCPECRKSLPHGMDLNRNTKMCSIIEYLNSTKSQRQGGCSYCDGTPEKLCLDCETPLCCDHLKKHKAGHVLTDVSTPLQSRKCPVHQELLKYYCMEEGFSICASCGVTGDHKHHKIVPLSDLSDKEKSALKMLEDLLIRKQAEKKEKVAHVKRHKEKIASNIGIMRRLVTGVIGEMKKDLESMERQILCQIKTQEDQVCSQLSQAMKSLEGQILEINNRIQEIQNLYNTSDPLTLLEKKARNANQVKSIINVKDDFHVDNLDGETILIMLQSSIHRFTRSLPILLKNCGIPIEDATSRMLPLNQITKNVPPFLVLTLDGQNVDSPRFAFSALGLSSGQHYWEVETREKPRWAVGVSYDKDPRAMGYAADYWCLQLTDDMQYKAVHNSQEMIVATNAPVNTLGVYLEYETGIVSFYQVSNNCVRCLCSLNGKFIQPLHIFMYAEHGGWIRIMK
ncbi:zinc-binding protein A33-like [Rana temporaria]|uniref:zinc-binding protein A33-like n=1 Tax=Rana temporaria TaxID=8407 RepID=UPI001AAD5DCA|nr:zinc-binding protein A33-like [Rana temporaria]